MRNSVICNIIVAILLKHFYENKRYDVGAAGICLDYIRVNPQKKGEKKTAFRRKNANEKKEVVTGELGTGRATAISYCLP